VRRAAGEAPLPGAAVLARLLAAGRPKAPAPGSGLSEPRRFLASDGRLVMEASAKRGGGIGLTLAPGAARPDLEQAFAQLLDYHAPGGVLGRSPA
jgi:hypothetical protein